MAVEESEGSNDYQFQRYIRQHLAVSKHGEREFRLLVNSLSNFFPQCHEADFQMYVNVNRNSS